MDINVILFVIIICLLITHHFLTNRFDTWRKLDIPGPMPIPLFGNLKDVCFGKIHLLDCIRDIYRQYPSEPAIGVFATSVPILLVKDLDLVQEVLIKSFTNFGDRGFTVHKDADPLSQHLLYMSTEKWKPMRKKLSPVFTSARLKTMFYLISTCADNFVNYTQKLITKNENVDCLELSVKYAMDVITVCAFGLESKIFSQEKSEFERIGEMIFACNIGNMLRRLVRYCPHWVAKLTEPITKNKQLNNFFINLMKENIIFRKNNDLRREDFVDLLMDLKEQSNANKEEEMTIELVTAQAYVFFVGGFDTSSNAIVNCLYELALNPDIQDKLRNEIKKTTEENEGKINFNDIKNMHYLDQVLKETLRKYSPGYATMRMAKDDYTFSGTKIKIPRGVRVIIPIDAIQNDPNHYPEPEKFDPSRFTKENEKSRHPMAYLPFGAGPRACIGERFALISTKLGIAKMISRFNFKVCNKTCIPYEKKIGKFLLSPKGGLFLKVEEI